MKKMIILSMICLVLSVQAATPSFAATDALKKKKKAWDTIVTNTCPTGFKKPSPHCSSVVTPTFDRAGKLWLAWVNDGHVYVSSSDDKGKTLSAPMKINAQARAIDHNGENRPKVLSGPEGELYVSYTIKAKKKYTGDVFFSRSLDDGKSFDQPRSINDHDGPTSLRFENLAVRKDGHLYLTWLDKRDLFAAKAAKIPYSGSAIYYSTSSDKGATWSENRMLAEHTCECCRIAIDMDGRDLPVIIWRHVFEGSIRDHGTITFADLNKANPMARLSNDEWELDGCPHHGPALSFDAHEVAHVTWFTSGEKRQGPFYARSTDGGKTFNNIQPIGPNDEQAEHPFVVTHGGIVYVTWKAFDDDKSVYRIMKSKDAGLTWSEPQTVMQTMEESDHPFLIVDDANVYASWWTSAEGWRVALVTEG